MSLAPGDIARLNYGPLTVDGVATDATVTLTVTTPTGVVSSPTVTHTGTGLYQADYLTTTAGTYLYRWVASGTATDVEEGTFAVYSVSLCTVDEVKARLNKTLTVDDDELRAMIRAAEAEYTEWVAPVGTITETFSGGTDRLVLRAPRVTALTAAAYSDGTTISLTDLNLDPNTGIVYWGYGTAGFFTWGTRNVTLTYTATDLPANHREAIIADVAGYFEASQQPTGGGAFDGNDYDQAPYRTTPSILFPRIRALAPPRVG